MAPRVYPQWDGFERSPEGTLLGQVIDLDGAMGLAYERSVGFRKDFHTHHRLMLVCPRGACRMEVRSFAPRVAFAVDAAGVLIVPSAVRHDDEGVSTVYDTLALYPSDELLAEACRECGIAEGDCERLTREIRGVPRSAWLAELLERYFAERVLGRKAPIGSQALLERQILHETLGLAFPLEVAPSPPERVGSLGQGDVLARALTFIEANLFEPFDVPELCRAIGTSESSLLRDFRRAIGVPPKSYVRSRRLDEAARLLAGGVHPVSDVALLVGYEDLSAFTKAFKSRFGVAPRDYRAAPA